MKHTGTGPMTLDQARAEIGRGVVYHSSHDTHEHGRIRSVGDRFVFVVYDGDHHAKATDPGMLTLDVAR